MPSKRTFHDTRCFMLPLTEALEHRTISSREMITDYINRTQEDRVRSLYHQVTGPLDRNCGQNIQDKFSKSSKQVVLKNILQLLFRNFPAQLSKFSFWVVGLVLPFKCNHFRCFLDFFFQVLSCSAPCYATPIFTVSRL